jgi:hypothetical protein
MSFETVQNSIQTCLATRNWLAQAANNILQSNNNISEQQFAALLKAQFKNNNNLHSKGWYEPPPDGISALFSSSDNFNRLQYDTLRKQQFWPQANYKFDKNGAGMLYASPIDKASGIIGDWGITIYRGEDASVQSHIAACLHVLELASDYAQVGMELRELHDYTQHVFKENKLNNARTIAWTDTTGTNLGHTIPWTYEAPTTAELEIIKHGPFEKLKGLISNKRIHINSSEHFKIQETMALTLEARLDHNTNSLLPNTYFHLIISFQNGVKQVSSGFNDVFKAVGMGCYIKSRFG